jgi:hypothetical protein
MKRIDTNDLALRLLGFGSLLVLLWACAAAPKPAPERSLAAQSVDLAECRVVGTLDNGNVLMECPAFPAEEQPTLEPWTATPAPSDTPAAYPPPDDTATDVPPSATVTATVTQTATAAPSDTPAPTDTPTTLPSVTAVALSTPYPAAPACQEHDNGTFHTLWNSVAGCHYDHEHGQNPLTPSVAAAFPGFNLLSLLGTLGVGHTNPSSPVENTDKHGGFKWDVNLAAPNGCAVGFESGTVAIDAYAVQYHAFGPQSVELEARNHSAAALLRQCKTGSDYGYLYVTTLQEYGQRVFPYQGQVLLYPNDFLPRYDSPRGPYFTTEGYGNCAGARPSLAFYNGSLNANNLTVWTSKRTGPVSSPRPSVPLLFRLLFRGRDAYQSLDCADLVHPFTWSWACGGLAYNPANSRYNNSTTTVHEVMGDIPAAWDNLAGWDTEPQVGRVTVDGYITNSGQPAAVCMAPGTTCYVVKAVRAFVGRYSSDFCAVKCSNPTPNDTPERDIYWCGVVVCTETAPGAVPSGWVGPNN